uniref:Uncharacterized protein n=1 Tax=Timema poppense TaxID=170557 RepID=A0A7R9D5V0_TIMPO|nr:unnamed protein product [Timema poppensis]
MADNGWLPSPLQQKRVIKHRLDYDSITRGVKMVEVHGGASTFAWVKIGKLFRKNNPQCPQQGFNPDPPVIGSQSITAEDGEIEFESQSGEPISVLSTSQTLPKSVAYMLCALCDLYVHGTTTGEETGWRLGAASPSSKEEDENSRSRPLPGRVRELRCHKNNPPQLKLLQGARAENHFGKNTFSTRSRDSNLDLPVIGSLVYCESGTLDHAAIELSGTLETRSYPHFSGERVEHHLVQTTHSIPDRDSNLDLPVINSLVCCDNRAFKRDPSNLVLKT